MAMGLLTGALVRAVMGKVAAVASTHIEDYFKRWKGMEEELQLLKMLLPQIQSVVDAAERGEQQISEPLREWLRQLKDALYEADDVLDELHYLQLKQQVDSKSRAIKFATNIFKADPPADKLRRAVKKFGEVAAVVGNFIALVSNPQPEFQQQEGQAIRNRETGPLLTENKVVGREKERDELLRWLTADHEDESKMNVSLLSVVGHGGMGKTTLAQLVFNDEMVQNSFVLKIWVCVSTSFDVRSLTRSILESATNQRPDVDEFPKLQDALKEKLKTSGKFLLILDDVWNDDNSSNWDKLLAPLKHGHKGSKILLTTRMNQVADMAARAMGASTKGSRKLGGLNCEDFSSLFNHYAFAGVDYGNYPILQSIGMQIAERLGSSPLAAKTVGGLLNSNLDDRYWTKILDSKNISDRVQNGEDNIISILMLSYHHLPLHLRPCFAYCGMFPKDHMFRKEDLVLMWMAVGFIQKSHQNQGEMLEDIGGDYFDELLRRSLFDHGDDDSYVMHDLLHDLAQSVSHGECSCFVDNDKKVEDTIPNTARHLYIDSRNLDLLTMKVNWHNLCSLVLCIYGRSKHSVLKKVLKSLKSIRLLCVYVRVGKMRVRKMPDAFSHLIHLRSLNIDGQYLKQFPRSLCKLYHLQVLRFPYEVGTIKLPESMNKLVNLRHLSANDQVAGVGKLRFLQELDFSVKKERGYEIGVLGDLISLHKLSVRGLENVENQEEASKAKLCDKKYLETLDLVWGVSSYPGTEKDELVLDHLQPHANLKKLTIGGYRGISHANWRLPFLEKLELNNMPAIKKLDYQCQHLKELIIYNMAGVEELSGWHPHLHTLKIINCPKLEVLPSLSPAIRTIYLDNLGLVSHQTFWLDRSSRGSTSGSSSLSSSHVAMEIHNCGKITSWCKDLLGSGADAWQWEPHLNTLKIINYPKLEVLPSLSLSIREIYLDNVGLVSLPTLWLDRSSTSGIGGSSSTLSSLQVLRIRNCRKITSLGNGLLQLQHYLMALVRLQIWNCPQLVDFPFEVLQHLRALEYLWIENCPKLQVAPDPITPDGNDDKFLPLSLQSLEIERCAELVRSMPRFLKGLEELSGSGADAGQWHPHLHTLRIINCPKLEVLPSLSLSIERIYLDNLGLVSLPTLWLDHSSTCSTSGSSSSSPSLKVLEIRNCGKITSLGKGLPLLQHYLTALVRLEIHNCPELVDFPSEGLQHLRALKYLRIENCPKLQVAPDPITPDGNDDKFLPLSLDELILRDCEELVSLEGLMGLQSVGLLRIGGCPKLVHAVGSDFTIAVDTLTVDDPILLVSGVFTSVRRLTIGNWRQVESMDGQLEAWFLQNRTTLEVICIRRASSLKSLPGCLKNLSSLEYLLINEASETLKERCRKDEGADWPTITHIPKIKITSTSYYF